MFRTFIFIFGLAIFFSGIFLGNNLKKDEKQALALDDKKTIFGFVDENVPPPCSWEVKSPERVMSENKSQAIIVQLKNTADKECESTLSLRAPGFDLSPGKEDQSINLMVSNKGSLSWIMTPRKTGTFEIAVSDILNTKIFGITVNNMFGFSAGQAKIFSFIGSLFGPMFTIPWWLDKWHRRKYRQETFEKETK
ncbi:hypothetical protein HY612_05040 [Candidatus Roizmanbacteria bacterium]|nr:hypothetical protein [Candidatus Roizmanbacteria bacterium]